MMIILDHLSKCLCTCDLQKVDEHNTTRIMHFVDGTLVINKCIERDLTLIPRIHSNHDNSSISLNP